MFFVEQPRQIAKVRLISSAWVRLTHIFFMNYPISASNVAKSPKFQIRWVTSRLSTNGFDLWHLIYIASSGCLLSWRGWRRLPGGIYKVKELVHIWLGGITRGQTAQVKPLFDELKN